MFQSGLCSSSELETSRGSIRIQHLTGSSHGMEASTSRFPRLEECAHFHYEFAEIGPLQVKQSPHSWYLVIIIFCDFRLSSARTQRTRGSQGPRSIWWLCPLKNRIIGQETSKFTKLQLGFVSNFVLIFRRWLIRRTLEDFQSLDRQLHTCVYDRRYSQLPVIHQRENMVHGDKVSIMIILIIITVPVEIILKVLDGWCQYQNNA